MTADTVPSPMHHQVKQTLQDNIVIIRAAFQYYCMFGAAVGESAFSMTLNNWTSFIQDCQILDHVRDPRLIYTPSLIAWIPVSCWDCASLAGVFPTAAWDMIMHVGGVLQRKGSPTNQTAMDTLFITVNFEEEKTSDEAKENDDRALMRCAVSLTATGPATVGLPSRSRYSLCVCVCVYGESGLLAPKLYGCWT